MADKSKLNFTQASEIITAWKQNKTTPYTRSDLLELDTQLCGLLAESKAGRGVYYSYHTMLWLLDQLGADIEWKDKLLDYTNYTTPNAQVVKGLSVQVAYQDFNKVLKDTRTPVTLQIMDNKMNTLLDLDAGEVEFGIQRTRVKAVAEASGLGHVMWLKPDFVISKMQESNNPYFNTAVTEQNRLSGAGTTQVITNPTTGTRTRTSKTKTPSVAIPPVDNTIVTTPSGEMPANAIATSTPVAPTPVAPVTPVAPTPVAPTPTINMTPPSNIAPIQVNVTPNQPNVNMGQAPIQVQGSVKERFMNKCVADNEGVFQSKVVEYCSNVKGMQIPNIDGLDENDMAILLGEK